VVESEVWLKQP